MDKQWSVYISKFGDPDSPFGRVNPQTALTVVEKFVDLKSMMLIICLNSN